DPLEAAPKNIEPSRKALEEYNLPVNDKNIFLVMAAMVPGKKLETNQGIRLLTGKPKIDVPLKKKEVPKQVAAPSAVAPTGGGITGPVTNRCTVEEGGSTRTFTITVEPIGGNPGTAPATVPAPVAVPVGGTDIKSTFAGAVEVADIMVKVGDPVTKGQTVAAVEAMKAKHDIKSQVEGTVTAIHVGIGDEIDATQPIMTIA
ncbi:MAG: hypothetical protein KAU36_06815, partial [candidate division Zixibacteria bacterium]|nr:hypothetical protein [candidate division Zixibacteria bacterium]